uniref:Calcitonin peptide-like domain-containing protein n=1 Tax=Cyprinodon variegatus TaxID=28743 RepID=A0A3Q2D1L2_CYPVA
IPCTYSFFSLHVLFVCPLPNSMDRPLTKRCSNLSTCVLGKLSQELHKLQTFPRTNVGAGTPGKKRSAPERDSYAGYGESFDGV